MISSLRRPSVGFTLAGALLATAACGGGTGGAPKESATAASSSPQSPSATATSGSASWVVNEDSGTGITFELPEKVTPQIRTVATGGEARLYSVQSGTVGMAVSIIPTNSRSATPGYAKAVMTQLVSSLSQAGATDAKVSEVKDVDLARGSAVDGLITFTATTAAKVYWRLRVILTGKSVVQVQALPADGTSTTDRPAIDAAFAKLTASVQVP
jgi:hypothetical protein